MRDSCHRLAGALKVFTGTGQEGCELLGLVPLCGGGGVGGWVGGACIHVCLCECPFFVDFVLNFFFFFFVMFTFGTRGRPVVIKFS